MNNTLRLEEQELGESAVSVCQIPGQNTVAAESGDRVIRFCRPSCYQV